MTGPEKKKQLTKENFREHVNYIQQPYDNLEVGKYYYMYDSQFNKAYYGEIKFKDNSTIEFRQITHKITPGAHITGKKWENYDAEYAYTIAIYKEDVINGIQRFYMRKQLHPSGGRRKTRRAKKSKRHTRRH